MDGKGWALDNIFVERLWRSVKYEEVYLKQYQCMQEAKAGLADYFRFYNHQRPHQALENRTLAEGPRRSHTMARGGVRELFQPQWLLS